MNAKDIVDKILLGVGVILSGVVTALLTDLIRRRGWRKDERLKRRVESFNRCLGSVLAFEGEVSRLEDLMGQGLTNPNFTRTNALQEAAEDALSIEEPSVGPEFAKAARKLVRWWESVAEGMAQDKATYDESRETTKLRNEMLAAIPSDVRAIVASGYPRVGR